MYRSIKNLMLRARSVCPRGRRSQISFLASVWVIALSLVTAFVANGQAPAGTAAGAISTITSERNVKNDSGELTVIMKRLPGDPRSGETGHVLVSLSETVQGGFGSGPLPVEKAAVVFSTTRPDGAAVAGGAEAAGGGAVARGRARRVSPGGAVAVRDGVAADGVLAPAREGFGLWGRAGRGVAGPAR